jgi:hypothetical protein
MAFGGRERCDDNGRISNNVDTHSWPYAHEAEDWHTYEVVNQSARISLLYEEGSVCPVCQGSFRPILWFSSDYPRPHMSTTCDPRPSSHGSFINVALRLLHPVF